MKTKKLSLEKLEVESFVTHGSIDKESIVGGVAESDAGMICISFESYTASGPTGLTIGTVQITATITTITLKTVQTQGPDTQSNFAVACSRLGCQTYGFVGIEC